jgi:hypothetical protein
MRGKTFLFIAIAVFLIFANTKVVFSQDVTIKGGAIPESESEPGVQWVWGDVVNLDTQNKTLVVKYLDYETDQDKEIAINVDDKTVYENIKSIDEIKLKDTVSVDYIVGADGKSIARNLSVEKPESLEGMQEGVGGLTEELPSGLPEETKTTPAE